MQNNKLNSILGENCVQTTGGSSPDGTRCMFPFEYKGKLYNSCIATEHTQLWCMTDTKVPPNWGNCMGACGKFKTV